jgi:hypothetical protein
MRMAILTFMSFIFLQTLPQTKPVDRSGGHILVEKFKYTLIDRHLEIYDDSTLLQQAIGTRRRRGYDGLEQGCRPIIYDTIQLTNKIWDENIQEGFVLKC